jgi:hypothetical protein
MKLIRAQGLDMSINDKEEIMKSTEKELVDYINWQFSKLKYQLPFELKEKVLKYRVN